MEVKTGWDVPLSCPLFRGQGREVGEAREMDGKRGRSWDKGQRPLGSLFA